MAYSDKVIDHYENPRNVGSFDKGDESVGTGMVGAPACGDVMKLQIKVNPSTGVIEDARFKTYGCGSAIASSSLVTEWVKGKTLDEAASLKNSQIAEELALPPVKIHCSILAEDAIKAAVDDLNTNRLPKGVTITPIYDRTDLVNNTLGTVSHTLLEGLGIVLLVLFVFLGSARAALLTAVTIPLVASLLAALNVGPDVQVLWWALALGACLGGNGTLIGASDAGAHLDMIDSFAYCTTMVARAVREHALMPLEEAVNLLTGVPAALYGLVDRGTVTPGAWADLQVFDPDTVGPGPVSMRFDLPGGAGRVYGEAVGVHHVMVNGVPCVEGGAMLPARPGRVLRSGTDTRTVAVR